MIDSNNENNILTAGYDGLRVFDVSVETVLKRGLFQFDIVGLASKTVSESKQRILSAIQSCKLEGPRYINKKIITLLSPADDKKEGSHFDLPIAVSYLIANGIISAKFLKNIYIFGELTLRGSLRKAKNINLIFSQSNHNQFKYVIIPRDQNISISDYPNLSFLIVDSLQELISSVQGSKDSREFLAKFSSTFHDTSVRQDLNDQKNTTNYSIDLIEDLEIAKRALLIALAGKHHIVFVGPPGIGKSMLAKASAELIAQNNIQTPFREPHHTSSYSVIVGHKKYLGEIALANKGILYFDELIEFNRRVLESLRQPLEDGYIIHSELGKLESDFVFIGAMNPCGCGYKNLKSRTCVCSSSQISRYNRKIQSPLFERISIKVHLSEKHKSKSTRQSSTSDTSKLSGKNMISIIESVRNIQSKREEHLAKHIVGGVGYKKFQLGKKDKENILKDDIKHNLSRECGRILSQFIEVNSASKRLEKNILLLSRTIADIENCTDVLEAHILEAINYTAG